ncbi:hypothetical protein GCM10027160_24120 [Streptomyces calidiresistens]
MSGLYGETWGRWVTEVVGPMGRHLLWTGPRDVAGRPVAGRAGRCPRAALWVLDRGVAPAGPLVPWCGQRWCVEPDHQEERPVVPSGRRAGGRAGAGRRGVPAGAGRAPVPGPRAGVLR